MIMPLPQVRNTVTGFTRVRRQSWTGALILQVEVQIETSVFPHTQWRSVGCVWRDATFDDVLASEHPKGPPALTC